MVMVKEMVRVTVKVMGIRKIKVLA